MRITCSCGLKHIIKRACGKYCKCGMWLFVHPSEEMDAMSLNNSLDELERDAFWQQVEDNNWN